MKINGDLILQQVFPSVIFGWSTNTTIHNLSVKPSTPALILSDGYVIVNEYRIFGAESISPIELWRSPPSAILLDESQLKELCLILTDYGCLFLTIYDGLTVDDVIWSVCPSYDEIITTSITSLTTTSIDDTIIEKIVSTETGSGTSILWWIWFIIIVLLLMIFAVFYVCRRSHTDNTQWTTATYPPAIDCDGVEDKEKYHYDDEADDVLDEDAQILHWAQSIERHDEADEAFGGNMLYKVKTIELEAQICSPGMNASEYNNSLGGENPSEIGLTP